MKQKKSLKLYSLRAVQPKKKSGKPWAKSRNYSRLNSIVDAYGQDKMKRGKQVKCNESTSLIIIDAEQGTMLD